MFEKADSSPLRNSIENGSFQQDNYIIPLSNQVWDKKTTIAVKSGFLNKVGKSKSSKRWVELQNQGTFCCYSSKKRVQFFLPSSYLLFVSDNLSSEWS
jgi:hypothetical protein